MADAVSDSDKLKEQIVEQGAKACIKSCRNRKGDRQSAIQGAAFVECLLQKLNRYLRTFTRYDKFAVMFLVFIHVAFILFGYFNLFNTP